MVNAFRAANRAALLGADARRMSFQNLGSLNPRQAMGSGSAGLRWWQVSLTVSGSLSGGGLGGAALALPYAVAAVGWLGLLLIAVVTLVTACTGTMLVRTFNALNHRKRMLPKQYLGDGFVVTYDQLAQELLGRAGGTVMREHPAG
eukprot:3575208-Prymnesium_polylepis.1